MKPIKKKKVKSKSSTWYRKKCVEMAKKQAKELVGYKCEHCGRTKEQGYQMHGSHIYSEGTYKSMSADVDNILCLCAKCHVGGGAWANKSVVSWHEDPIYFADWFRENYPERYQALRLRARELRVVDWEKKYHEMKAKYKGC